MDALWGLMECHCGPNEPRVLARPRRSALAHERLEVFRGEGVRPNFNDVTHAVSFTGGGPRVDIKRNICNDLGSTRTGQTRSQREGNARVRRSTIPSSDRSGGVLRAERLAGR